MMYDELVKNLRHDSASALQNCEFDFVHDWMLKAADAIEELEKQLDEEAEYATALACNVPHWIPVTERLPEEEGSVLIFSKLGGIAEGRYSQTYGIWTQYRWNIKDIKVTHWMPLPKPPKEET